MALLCVGLVSVPSALPDPKRRQNPQALEKQFEIITIAKDLEQPSDVEFLPDGNMLVAEKGGKLWLFKGPDNRKLLLDISDHVATQRERGFNGIAVAHDFVTSRRVYLLYAFKTSAGEGRQAMHLSYITLNAQNEVQNPGAPETVILGKDAAFGRGCPPVSNKRDCPPSINSTHQGGTVISAPDGTLWVGFGDSNLPSNPGAQTFRTYNPASTSGKILHLDTEGNGLPNHPFCRGNKDLTRTCTKVYAEGFRNPFRMTLTPKGTPLVSDVGWNLREEIDLITPGGNYGWPCYEGDIKTPFYREMGRCKGFYGKGKSNDLVRPIFDYRNPPGGGAAGAAVIVGPHYASGAYPQQFHGGYFFGDYAKAFVGVLEIKKNKTKATHLVTGVAPVAFDIAPSGNIVFVDFITGAVRELFYSPNNKQPTARIFASPTSGPGPNMTVNFSALDSSDPDGNSLSYQWDFDGDGNVDSTSPSDSFTYTSNGTFTARLTVNDGLLKSTASQTITVGNTIPSASITSPAPGALSRVGTPVVMQGTASDAEDGTLPPSAFHWNVVLVHKEHTHPLGTFVGNPAQFEPVTDHDADSHYEVTLTVTDNGGPGLGSLSTRVGPVSVGPETVPLKVISRPAGVELSYGGREIKSRKRFLAAIGFQANLTAPAEAKIDGDTYHFVRWKHGGKRTQIYPIPAAGSKVVAVYKDEKK